MARGDEELDGERPREEAFYYGNKGWIVGLCVSAALLWIMFALADRIG